MAQGPSTSLKLKIEIAQASDPGRDPNKQVNEDSCGFVETQFGHLAVLCDGMGGHHGGQEASRRAITAIFEHLDKASADSVPITVLKEAVEVAARQVYELGGPPENRTRPGSTVVAMLMHDKGVDVAHVGDSRAYVIRSGQIYALTRDHSMVQGLIDSGQITEEQAIGHPDANKITRALGMRPEVEVEVRPEPMELFKGDILLQSSDGLTDLALSQDILRATQQALNSGGLEHACKQLVQLANDRGGHDNITVQIARVLDTGPKLTAVPASTTPPNDTPETIPMNAPAAAAQIAALAANAARPSPGGAVAPTAPPGAGPTIEQGPLTPHPPSAGAPISPTANDVPPASGHGMPHVAPTTPGNTSGPQSNPVWSSGMFSKPGPGLSAYSEGAAGSLPLPPQVTPTAPQVGPVPTIPQAATPGPAYPGANPVPAVHYGDPSPARGGIVFLITGISIVVAVLILVLLWLLGFLS